MKDAKEKQSVKAAGSFEEVSCEILEHVGCLSRSGRGWQREVNIVSWNGKPAKLDIREWNEEHTRKSRGVCLTVQETEALKQILHHFEPESLQTAFAI